MPVLPDLAAVTGVLARLEDNLLARRRAEVEDLQLVLVWADLHRLEVMPELPGDAGGERSVELGGDGTPHIHELALCELGIARRVHTLAARAVVADVLDLRHRLPRVWTEVVSLEAEVWLARKVASLTRNLTLEQAGIVDTAVAAAIGAQSPARVLDLAAAKIIEADPWGHDARAVDERRRRFIGLGRTDEHGLRMVIARVTAGDAHWIEATLSRVVDILAAAPGHTETSTDELRSIAFGWLARPAELLALLLENTENTGNAEQPEQPEVPDRSGPEQTRALALPADLLEALRDLDPTRLRPRGVLYLHLHEEVLAGVAGVARVEGLGPHTSAMLRALLGTVEVTVKPVIDLADRIATTAYEHPTAITERIHLLRPGDAFPHATTMSRAVDLDHVVAYDPGGPPGQTSSHTSQPLSRTAHRAKTHVAYRCTPLPGGEIIWESPHGLQRLVDHRGTTALTPTDHAAWTGPSTVEQALARLIHRHR